MKKIKIKVIQILNISKYFKFFKILKFLIQTSHAPWNNFSPARVKIMVKKINTLEVLL